jgi:hypothetical protein
MTGKEEFFDKLHNVEAELPIRDVTSAITEASAVYDDAMAARHAMGNEKYGAVKFLSVNSIEEAMAEIVDLGNYARYTFIKLYLINRALREEILPVGEDVQMLGDNSFVPNGKFGT